MVNQITEGVSISVEVFYQLEHSNPSRSEYLFAYRITIENLSDFPVQLMRRHWFIFDASGLHREVEGEGVVGVQPLLKPGESYKYTSSAYLNSDLGKMLGDYTMENKYNKKLFKVTIPQFQLIAPFKLN